MLASVNFPGSQDSQSQSSGDVTYNRPEKTDLKGLEVHAVFRIKGVTMKERHLDLHSSKLT